MSTQILRRRRLGATSVSGIRDASQTGISCYRNDSKCPDGTDIVIRWGCTSNVPNGVRIINPAAAIHEVSDKAGFRIKCSDAGLSPKSWLDIDSVPTEILDDGVILRKAVHSQGRHIHLCHSVHEVLDKTDSWTGYYVSEYIKKTQEFRVYVVQGRVVAVAEKIPEDKDALAWNHAGGGNASFVNVKWSDWPIEAVDVSVKAFLLPSLDFGGVDVMVDEDGKAYVLEINSAPSLTSAYRQQCFAKAFDWMTSPVFTRRVIPITSGGGWKSYIHPAISDKAEV